MLCPILRHASLTSQKNLNLNFEECKGGECAWWDPDNETCALTMIAPTLYLIFKQLLAMVEKMATARE